MKKNLILCALACGWNKWSSEIQLNRYYTRAEISKGVPVLCENDIDGKQLKNCFPDDQPQVSFPENSYVLISKEAIKTPANSNFIWIG